jgi:hypothetical protein
MASAAAFKAWINSNAPFQLANANPRTAAQPLVPHQLGALLIHLDTLCGGADNRRAFLRYCFANEDNDMLHCRHINALFYWLHVRPDGEGKWVVTNPNAQRTARAVVAEAQQAGVQAELPL